MAMYENVLDLVGHTPLVRLYTGIPNPGPRAYVKLEYYNPTGSVKDRMTGYVLQKAIREGRIAPGDTVIDNTSGNTGSALAMAASVLGLRAIVTTPVKTSKEKIDLIRSFGAEVIVTPETDHDDPRGFYAMARRLAKEHGYFDLDQYDSQDNVEAHYMVTGPEIWDDTNGKITHFVCGIGTGGTFSGAVKYLKEKNPDIVAVAVDPAGSVFGGIHRGETNPPAEPYKVEGIGSDVPTRAMHMETIDQLITVPDSDAFNRARKISREEGISGGGSSGAVACAMEQVAADLGPEALIVGIFADGGIKYLSKCYNDEWMKEMGFLPEEEYSK